MEIKRHEPYRKVAEAPELVAAPGVAVSWTGEDVGTWSASRGIKANFHRHGSGPLEPLPGDGAFFMTRAELEGFALDHGYLVPYMHPRESWESKKRRMG